MITCDDFGNEVNVCKYTKVLLWPDAAVKVGAIIPGARSNQFMARTQQAKDAHAQSVRWFHEADANCNTCQHLQRVEHKKTADGFLHGACLKSGAPLKFHPHDPMHMQCHQLRKKQ